MVIANKHCYLRPKCSISLHEIAYNKLTTQLTFAQELLLLYWVTQFTQGITGRESDSNE